MIYMAHLYIGSTQSHESEVSPQNNKFQGGGGIKTNKKTRKDGKQQHTKHTKYKIQHKSCHWNTSFRRIRRVDDESQEGFSNGEGTGAGRCGSGCWVLDTSLPKHTHRAPERGTRLLDK